MLLPQREYPGLHTSYLLSKLDCECLSRIFMKNIARTVSRETPWPTLTAKKKKKKTLEFGDIDLFQSRAIGRSYSGGATRRWGPCFRLIFASEWHHPNKTKEEQQDKGERMFGKAHVVLWRSHRWRVIIWNPRCENTTQWPINCPIICRHEIKTIAFIRSNCCSVSLWHDAHLNKVLHG